MSQFGGSTHRVRCADCSRLSGNKCTAKEVKVAAKKRRVCASYEFSGDYQNREDADAVYIPYIERKTQRALRKQMAINLDAARRAMEPPEPQRIIMPRTTAVPRTPGVDEIRPEDKLIWTPDDD